MPIGTSKVGLFGGKPTVAAGCQTFNAPGTFTVVEGLEKVTLTGFGDDGNAGNPGNPGGYGAGGNGGTGAGSGPAWGGPANPLGCPGQLGGTGQTAAAPGSSGNPGNAGASSSVFCFNFAGGAGGAGGNAGNAGNAGNPGSAGTATVQITSSGFPGCTPFYRSINSAPGGTGGTTFGGDGGLAKVLGEEQKFSFVYGGAGGGGGGGGILPNTYPLGDTGCNGQINQFQCPINTFGTNSGDGGPGGCSGPLSAGDGGDGGKHTTTGLHFAANVGQPGNTNNPPGVLAGAGGGGGGGGASTAPNTAGLAGVGGGGGGGGNPGNSGNAGSAGSAANPTSYNCVSVVAGCYPVVVSPAGQVNISWNTQ